MCGQQQYPSQDYISMLIEEAEKLYNKLVKRLADKIISNHNTSTYSPSSLPLLPLPSDEEQQQSPSSPKTT